MGDMADYYLESQDYWNLDEELRDYNPISAKCKFCNKAGLQWNIEANGRWRLYDNGEPHTCNAYRQAVARRTEP